VVSQRSNVVQTSLNTNGHQTKILKAIFACFSTGPLSQHEAEGNEEK